MRIAETNMSSAVVTEGAYERTRLANGEQLIPDPDAIPMFRLANFKCNSKLFSVISLSW